MNLEIELERERQILARLGEVDDGLRVAANIYSSSIAGLPEEKAALIRERQALRERLDGNYRRAGA